MGFLEPGRFDTKPWIIDPNIRVFISMPGSVTQRQIALAVLAERGIARLAELRRAGVTAATMSRMERDREVIRLARGLYQLPDAELDANHSLAEAAKRSPKAVICLVSALAFHGLTDQLPRQVWLSIGNRDWAPKPDRMPIRIVRFTQTLLSEGVEIQTIEGVPVKIFGVAKTIAVWEPQLPLGHQLSLPQTYPVITQYDHGRRRPPGRCVQETPNDLVREVVA